MDPYTLSVAQLKNILRVYQLSTTERKAELIVKMQQADLTGAWMQEAVRQQSVENIAKDGDHEEGAMQKEEAAIQVGGNLARCEMEILAKERELIQKEVELLRRENDIAGFPRNSSSTTSRATFSIKNVSDLLSEYSGSGDDFER